MSDPKKVAILPVRRPAGSATGPAPPASPAGGPPGKLVKLTVDVPFDVEFRLHGLARILKTRKRELAGKLLTQGLEKYQEDRRLKAMATDLMGREEEVA